MQKRQVFKTCQLCCWWKKPAKTTKFTFIKFLRQGSRVQLPLRCKSLKKNIVGSAFGGEGNSTQYHRHSFRNESYEMADCQ